MAKDLTNFEIGISDNTLGGVALGHTKGGTEVTINGNLHEKKVDEYGEAPVGLVDLGSRIEIKIFMAESDLAHIAKTIPGATLTTGTTKDDVGIGKVAGSEIAGQTLVLHPVAAGVSVDNDWNFTKVVPISSPTFAFKVDEDRVFEMMFLAIIDDTATEGEKLVRIGTSD